MQKNPLFTKHFNKHIIHLRYFISLNFIFSIVSNAAGNIINKILLESKTYAFLVSKIGLFTVMKRRSYWGDSLLFNLKEPL